MYYSFILYLVILFIIFIIYINSIKTKKNIILTDAVKYSPFQWTGSSQKIPYVIIQTNKGDKISTSMKAAMTTIIEMNPEYEYKYFNNEECRNYLRDDFGDYYVQLFDSLVPGAYKADFFRICYLNKHGGVYIDSSFVAVAPLRELIDPDDEFIAPQEVGDGILNAFMCSIPGHPLTEENIKLLVYNISNKVYGKTSIHPTGPAALGMTYKKLYGKLKVGVQNNIKILEYMNSYTYAVINYLFLHSRLPIKHNGKIFFYTRYPDYNSERRGHYNYDWLKRKVYK